MVLFNGKSLGEQFRSLAKLPGDNNIARHHLSLVTGVPSRFVNGSYIAVLGFAEPVGWKNRSLAYHTGKMIAESGHDLLCGNTTSTFHYAVKGAREGGGLTQVILSENDSFDSAACENAYFVDTASDKHRLLVRHARAAIVIGGGPRTKKLVSRLVGLNRAVVAIEGTGGVVRNELPSKVVIKPTALEAVKHITSQFSH